MTKYRRIMPNEGAVAEAGDQYELSYLGGGVSVTRSYRKAYG